MVWLMHEQLKNLHKKHLTVKEMGQKKPQVSRSGALPRGDLKMYTLYSTSIAIGEGALSGADQ